MAYMIEETDMFHHVQKTGGKTVLKALQDAGNKVRVLAAAPKLHGGVAREDQLIREYDVDGRFGFVRRPAAWWKSFRDFHTSSKPRCDGRAVRVHDLTVLMADCVDLYDLSANDFVKEMVERHPGFYSRMLKCYYPEGKDWWVGHQEQLEQHLFDYCEMRGFSVPKKIGKENVSKPMKPGNLYPKTIARVEELESYCLTRFYEKSSIQC